jgi:2-polyprenyl-3-methyl-5-hydroxy-6-metoxy-1,4-benzoquinol methylase
MQKIHKHRKKGYKLLSGSGLEIGALHEPADLPDSCHVTYADVISKSDAILKFPEIDHEKLVDVDHICNIDNDSLKIFKNNTFDFVIFSHVIEHLANPINAIESLFRITKIDGMVVIAAPDKRYTFDKDRELTPFSHLKEEYNQQVKEVSDEHYLDFLHAVHPDVMKAGTEAADKALKSVRERREHAHVWSTDSFKAFLLSSFQYLNIRAQLCYENTGDKNHFEYFSVWRKVNANAEMVTEYKDKGLFSFLKSN